MVNSLEPFLLKINTDLAFVLSVLPKALNRCASGEFPDTLILSAIISSIFYYGRIRYQSN